MKRVLALAVALLFTVPASAVAQEGLLPVVGGKAVLTIVPDTVRDTLYVEIPVPICPVGYTCYAPGEEPVCPECPPPPVWECPDGWTCEPPPEPEDTIPPPMTSTPQVEVQDDTLVVVTWTYDGEPADFYVVSALNDGGEYKEAYIEEMQAGIVRTVSGDYYVCVQARDLAGNLGEARCTGYTISRPEPEGPFWSRSSTNELAFREPVDTLEIGSAATGDTTFLWVNVEEDTTIRRVVNFVGGINEGTENVWPYALKGDGGSPHHLYGWAVPDTLLGPIELRAVIEYLDATKDTIIGAIEIVNPNLPPDTVPPTGIDSVSIAAMLGFAQGEQPFAYDRLADYDSVFVHYSDQFWPRFVADRDTATRADPFIFHTYYDRMISHYEYWWRTGDEVMAERGDEYLLAIRDWYWVPNDYIQPRRVFPEGLLVHYYRTGDTLSLQTYTKLTDALTRTWWPQLTSTQYLDGRVQGRVVLGEVYRDAEMGRAGVDSLLAWHDRQILGPGRWSMTSYCGGQAHFQAFHAVLYAMIRYNDFVSNDRYAEIFPVVKATADSLWTMRNEDNLFPYVSWAQNAEGSCDNSIANDLNGLLMPVMAWLHRETYEEEYRTRATLMLDAMLDNTYWIGSLGKQYNQSFWQTQRALYWLKDRPNPPLDLLFGWRSDMGRWLGSSIRGDTLIAGDYVFHLRPRVPIKEEDDAWVGVDSVGVGVGDGAFTFVNPTGPVPLDNDDGSVTFLPDLFYLLPYTVWGTPGNEFGVIEARLVSVTAISVEWPDSVQLSAPTNLRVIQYPPDTSRHVIAWDAIPEAKQCENATGHPANCRDVYGDEVYYRLTNVEPPLNFSTNQALASTMRSFPLEYPGEGEILPDSISFCVTAEAWDCPNCYGPGGRVELPAQDTLHITRYYPISETTCANLEVL